MVRLDGHIGEWVLKLYRVGPNSPQGQHLISLVGYLQQQAELGRQPVLVLPHHAVIDERADRVGCLMPAARGEPLDGDTCIRLYTHPQGLIARLKAAARLAAAVAALHRHGIVHADLTAPNVLVEVTAAQPALLDIDGGGVLASPLGPTYCPGLAPLVRGRPEGSFLAPELYRDSRACPSLASDRWSLAVLLHYLLFGGLDPFFYVDYFADVVDPGVSWPPEGPHTGTRRRWVEFHLAERNRLGPLLLHLFRGAFNRPDGTARAFSLRPSADNWADVLELSARWVLRCPSCKEELVALKRTHCPFCGAQLPHPQVWTKRGGLVLKEEKIILGRDVGFTDAAGHHEVARFSRRGNKVLLFPRVPMRDLARGRDHTPQDPHPIEIGRGRHAFGLWSRDGRQRAEIRIYVP